MLSPVVGVAAQTIADMNGAHMEVFPVEDGLFEETFISDSVYKFCGEEFKITQAFSANLGVAAPVWDAVSKKSIYILNLLKCK